MSAAEWGGVLDAAEQWDDETLLVAITGLEGEVRARNERDRGDPWGVCFDPWRTLRVGWGRVGLQWHEMPDGVHGLVAQSAQVAWAEVGAAWPPRVVASNPQLPAAGGPWRSEDDGRRYTISLACTAPAERRRRTLAHELVHLRRGIRNDEVEERAVRDEVDRLLGPIHEGIS